MNWGVGWRAGHSHFSLLHCCPGYTLNVFAVIHPRPTEQPPHCSLAGLRRDPLIRQVWWILHPYSLPPQSFSDFPLLLGGRHLTAQADVRLFTEIPPCLSGSDWESSAHSWSQKCESHRNLWNRFKRRLKMETQGMPLFYLAARWRQDTEMKSQHIF